MMQNHSLFVIFLLLFANNMLPQQQSRPFQPKTPRESAEEILRTMENDYQLPPHDLIFEDIPGAYISGNYGLISINPKLINHEDETISLLAHELGHHKDNSTQKRFWGQTAYYGSGIITSLISFGLLAHKNLLMPRNTFIWGALVTASTALFWHGDLFCDKLDIHLEKRADYIKFEYLLKKQRYDAICSRLAYLEHAKKTGLDHGRSQPSPHEEFSYTKKFLEKKQIFIDSAIKDKSEGVITLTQKDGTCIGRYTWKF